MSVLELKNVHAGYGVGTVLHDVSLEVQKGEVVALVGPNGAGKSTTLNLISGILRASRGTISWDGTEITKMSPSRIVASGIAHCPQGRRVFPYLSTELNLRIGAYSRADRGAVQGDIDQFLDAWPVLGRRRDSNAGTLSGGEQQILAIGRALMSRPKMVLLDEPSLGLAPVLITQVYEVLSQVIANGETAVLLVEQNVAQALTLADRIVVLAGGSTVFRAKAAETSADEVASHYFETQNENGSGQ